MRKSYFLVGISFLGVLSAQTCSADLISGPELIYASFSLTQNTLLWSINLLIEVFFGWAIFFRGNKKALIPVAIINIISQPLAFLTYGLFPSIISFLLIELAVVVVEMLVYKFSIDGLSYSKALFISFLLNIFSVILGSILAVVLLLLFYVIG